MNLEEQTTELLFSYGTLQHEAVQLDTFGRRLKGTPDTLSGYRIEMIEIRDEDFVAKNGSAPQRNLKYTGSTLDTVEGTALELTREELDQADNYEPAEYKRKLVQLTSNVNAWVYLAAG